MRVAVADRNTRSEHTSLFLELEHERKTARHLRIVGFIKGSYQCARFWLLLQFSIFQQCTQEHQLSLNLLHDQQNLFLQAHRYLKAMN